MLAVACRVGENARLPGDASRAEWLLAFDTTDSALARLGSAAARDDPEESLRRDFAAARDAYKQIEAMVEFFAPAAARAVNGAPLDHFEDDAPDVALPAEGLQVVEALLFPTISRAAVMEQVPSLTVRLRAHLRRARGVVSATPITEPQVWEAARLELARLATIHLGGFDSPVAERTGIETARALEGIRALLKPWSPQLARQDGRLARDFDHAFESGIQAGDSALTGEFDRLGMLTDRLLPLAHVVSRARVRLGIPEVEVRSLLRPAAASPYDKDAFDAAGLDPAARSGPTGIRSALGARLFFATALSGEGTRSCASCHRPDRFFTDGRVRSAALPGRPDALRNTPTLLNAALQGAQFADGRVTYLEDQVAQVVSSPSEMHGSLDAAASRLGRDSSWLREFRQAFPDESSVVRPLQIRLAIASYVRSLVVMDAPFDRYVRGDRTALAPAARRGFDVFMGKGKCGSCHFAPLFNGTVPPGYEDQEYEIIGVPARPGSRAIDPDSGRVRITRSPLNRFAFKTPTVRNAVRTAPYMHNGVFGTLEEVIDFYEKGGGAGQGMQLPNQTLPFDRLHLTARDKLDLRAFLEALTDSIPRG